MLTLHSPVGASYVIVSSPAKQCLAWPGWKWKIVSQQPRYKPSTSPLWITHHVKGQKALQLGAGEWWEKKNAALADIYFIILSSQQLKF